MSRQLARIRRGGLMTTYKTDASKIKAGVQKSLDSLW